MSSKAPVVLFLGLLTIVLAYAVYRLGGVERDQWNLCLLALGLLALTYWLCTPRASFAPPPDPWLRWPILLLPCYAALQVIPLPAALLRVLSPARAELLTAIRPIAPEVAFAPLSVVPSITLAHFLRISAYIVTLLLIRELAWRLSEQPWAVAWPIILIASWEAVVGLLQSASAGPSDRARGTYINSNHYAGLLELSLPFAAVYPAAVLRHVAFRHLSIRAGLKATGAFAIAALIFMGIVYSFSRMGFIAALSSLFLTAALALFGSRLPARKKFLSLGLTAGALLLTFALLSPAQFILRVAELSPAEVDRPRVWSETLHLIAAYPLFGCGLGGYESAFLKFRASGPLVIQDYAHNDYLQYLAELGIFGFAIGAILLIATAVKTFRLSWKHSEPDGRWLARACAGAMTAIAIHSFADFNLYIPANALLFAWILGIVAGLECSRAPA